MKIQEIDKEIYLKHRESQPENCEVNFVFIEIKNLTERIIEIKDDISDTSWINNLDELDKETFIATSKRTIEKIVEGILAKETSDLNTDIGEYIVSHSAQKALILTYNHDKIPIAELLKEKIIGNPGFDFHTISQSHHLIFGEAKFSMKGTPKKIAIDQIADFISLKKDYAELRSLRPFINEHVEENLKMKKRGFAAAFSCNTDNIDLMFKNAITIEPISEILNYNELYLIAVKVC